MKKSNEEKSRTRILFGAVVPALLMLVLAFSLPAFAGTSSDSTGDAKLQAMKSDVMACMEPGAAGQKAREAFAKKYNVSVSKLNEVAVNKPPASNGGWDRATAQAVCMAEYLTGIGAGIWLQRKCIDKYNGGAYPYCIDFSMNFNHYDWHGHLEDKIPGCCSTPCK